MAKSTAGTVAEYLAALPADRRALVSALRAAIRSHLPKGYEETMLWGAISYVIPLSRLADTYNGMPLCYAAVASKKSFVTLHLPGIYMNPANERGLREAFARAGKKFKAGKGCVHFKTVDDAPLDAIGDFIAKLPVDRYIAMYEAVRQARATSTAARKAGRGKAGVRKGAARRSSLGEPATGCDEQQRQRGGLQHDGHED